MKSKRWLKQALRLVHLHPRRAGKRIISFYSHLHLYIQLTVIILAALLLGALGLVYNQLQIHHSYQLSQAERKLLAKTSIDVRKITQTNTAISYQAPKDVSTTHTETKGGHGSITLANTADATGAVPYQVNFNKDANRGISFGTADNDLSFSLVPKYSAHPASLLKDSGQVIYPTNNTQKTVYTLKRNGFKEDIVLTKAPGKTKTFQWQLMLGSSLEAKLLPTGGIGIFGPNPYLVGNVSVGDQKSQQLLDNAKKNGKKDYLVFVLPTPYMTDANGKQNYEDVSFKLDGSIITLEARNLTNQRYPLTIDPSVVVTTNSDFQKGSDDGMISYPGAGNINRSNVSSGAVGSWTTNKNYFINARYSSGVAAYNGYLYLIGGFETTANTTYRDVQFAPINADGSIGVWHYTHNSTDDGTSFVDGFTNARQGLGAIAYNGYLYIIGGCFNGSGCATYYNDVQKATLNADGTVGSWSSTSSFTTARSHHTVAAYNGYVYLMGGYDGTNYYNDVQYAVINADGTLGSWASTSSFTTARRFHASAVYNGFLYVIGGTRSGGVQNDVQYAPINSDGTVGTWATTTTLTGNRTQLRATAYNGYLFITGGFDGTNYLTTVQSAPIYGKGTIGSWTATTSFTTNHSQHNTLAYNGFLYLVGGYSGTSSTACKNGGTSFGCNDVQFAQVVPGTSGTGGGSNGSWSTTTAFTTARRGHSSVAYNGYLYVIGGYNGTNQNDVQYAPINADGTVGTWSSTTAFTTARQDHTSVAYNGYLYVIGGFISGGNYANDVQYAPINADGTVGTWSSTTAFTTGRYLHTSVAYNGYLYVIGGTNGTNQNDVQKAAINADGTVGTWSSTNAFTTARQGHTSVAYNGYLYVIGGFSSIYLSDVQKAAINADGTVGTWSSTTAFTTGRYLHTSVAYNGYLYVIGGTNGTNQNDVQKAAINADGTVGTWSSITAFTTARREHTSVAYNGYLYVIGGYDGSNFLNDVQYSLLASWASQGLGTVGTWALTTYLPETRYAHQSAVYDGYVYVLGGVRSGSTVTNTVKYAQLNNDGTTGSWSTTTSFTTSRYYHAAAVYKNYVYIFGGIDVSNNLLNSVQYAKFNSSGGGLASDAGCGSAWCDQTSFNTARWYHAAFAGQGYVYIVGGCSTVTICTTPQTDSQYAQITSDGSLATDSGCGSTWCTTSSLSTARYKMGFTTYNNYAYLTGGVVSGSTSLTVVSAKMNSDGTLGTWTSQTGMSAARSEHASVAVNGYLYAIGGHDGAAADQNTTLYTSINPDGSLGTWASSSTFTQGRYSLTSAAYNGNVYVLGGYHIASDQACVNIGSNSSPCNDVQYVNTNSQAWTGHYEKTIDIGYTALTLDSITINGYLPCSGHLKYSSADTSGVFGSVTSTPLLASGTTYPISGSTKRYLNLVVELDDSSCGLKSYIADITLNFTKTTPPSLVAPANGATGVARATVFQLRSADGASDYLRYKFDLCSNSDCSTIVSTITEPSGSPQTGWTGQDAQSSTAYASNPVVTSSTLATYTYQSSLSACTQYWWRGYAIDPAGLNTYTPASAISTYTTTCPPNGPTLVQPAASQTGVSTTPEFRLYGTDPEGDYLKYKIIVYQSDCSTIVRTIDQTSSQTGWQSQSRQSGTAYASGQEAVHVYQAPALAVNVTYCWKAAAIDPADTNQFGAYSATRMFTTSTSSQTNVNIGGGTSIYGGTTIGQ